VVVDPEHELAKVPAGGYGQSVAYKNTATVIVTTQANGYGFASIVPTAASDVVCLGGTDPAGTDTTIVQPGSFYSGSGPQKLFTMAPYTAAQFGINSGTAPVYEQAQSRLISAVVKVTNVTDINSRGGEAMFIDARQSTILGLGYADIDRLRAEGFVTDLAMDGQVSEVHYRPTEQQDYEFGPSLPNSYGEMRADTGVVSFTANPHVGFIFTAPPSKPQRYKIEVIQNDEYTAPANISSVMNNISTPLALHHPDVYNIHNIHASLTNKVPAHIRPSMKGSFFSGIGNALGWVGRQVKTVAKGAYNIVKPLASKKGLEFVEGALQGFAKEIPLALAAL
jgi:hypothetical protein